MSSPSRSPMTVSPLFVQAILVTFLVGFGIMGYLAIKVYQDHPPLPGRVVSDAGQTIFTANDIRAGQELFLTYGLMQYGSIYGHGAYLGPDFTADYLHRQAIEMQTLYGGGPVANERVRQELQANRYDPKSDSLTWTKGQVDAFEKLYRHYQQTVLNRETSGGGGLGPHAISDPDAARRSGRVYRLDSVDFRSSAPGPALFVHEQLAARGTRRQSTNPGGSRLEHAFDCDPAGRHGAGAGALRSLLKRFRLARN